MKITRTKSTRRKQSSDLTYFPVTLLTLTAALVMAAMFCRKEEKTAKDSR
ncbi:MAG: hypothetical protein ACLTK0_07615 [Anaerovoracaceae bacterium]